MYKRKNGHLLGGKVMYQYPKTSDLLEWNILFIHCLINNMIQYVTTTSIHPNHLYILISPTNGIPEQIKYMFLPVLQMHHDNIVS